MSVWYALEMNVPPLYYYDLYVLLCCCILFTFYLYLLLLLLLFLIIIIIFIIFYLIVQHFGQCMLCVNVLYKYNLLTYLLANASEGSVTQH